MRPLAFLLLAGTFLPHPSLAAEKLTVVASIFPLYEFAREVGGERVEVSLLIPPGSETHSWEPRASDVTRIRQASLFLYLGEFLEPWAPRVLDAAGVKASLGAGQGLARAGEDPHLWLDLSLDLGMVDAIASRFARLDPPGAEGYRARAADFKQRLARLDEDFRRGLADCPRREFVFAGHSAFGRLAARYGLAQIAVSGPSPESEPAPRTVASVVRTLREKGLGTVFYEELVNPDLARVIAAEAGAATLPLSPGHELTLEQWKGKATFLSLMEGNLANLRKGLGCE